VLDVRARSSVRETWFDRPVASVRRRCRYTLPGLSVAVVLACLSFTPSLLPRPAFYQGIVTGIDAAIGYGLGVLGAWVWREFADREPRPAKPRSWRVWAIASTVALLASLVLGRVWQRQAAELIGEPPEAPAALLLVPLIGVLLFVALVALGRAVRTAYRRLAALLERHMGRRAARATGLVLLVAVLVLLLDGVLWRALVGAADSSFAVRDTLTPGDVVQPTSTLRSGGPGSLLEWDSLGREGRAFSGRGPDADAISDFTGVPAQEPVRSYASLAAAEDTEDRAALAVDELQRAGGFERANLLVITTTGTGWVEPSSAASFEYLTGGDSASVAIQYSHLPSWLSFLVDQEKAREAGRELFDAVYARWSAMPAADRPRLYVFGESLGSFGGENAFSGEYDLANRTDGALFVGPPSFNPSYRRFVDGRDPGSREVLPVYRKGRIIRFTNLPRSAIPPAGRPWPGTRVLYMQHPSDPIVWWSPDLVLRRPDWLSEQRGRDVLGSTRWVPFVTFWQLSADLALGFSTPAGHGHNYSGEHVDGWAAVLRPDGWSAAKADELRGIILGRP